MLRMHQDWRVQKKNIFGLLVEQPCIDRAEIGTRAKKTEEKGRGEKTPLSPLPSLRFFLSLVPISVRSNEEKRTDPTKTLATHATYCGEVVLGGGGGRRG